MRPDEHKKKRSTQYKKKHGINKDDQSKDSRQPKSKSAGGKGKVKVDQRLEGKKSDSHAGAAKPTHSSSGSDSSDNDQESAQVHKTFKRREVVSNWARYEILPPDTETTQKKGEDFVNLLNTAGGTSSQFRFKEEEDWEEGESVCTDAKLLTIDPSDLAASFQCIPLYHRLGVDQDLFSAEQILEMEADAKEHTLQYQNLKLADVTQPHNKSPHTSDIKQQDNTSPCKTDHTQPQVDNDKVPSVVDTVRTGPGQKKDEHLVKSEPVCHRSAAAESNQKDPLCNVGASVNTTPVVRTPVINTHTNTGETTGGVTSNNLEDDLDFLLSLDNPSDSTDLGETTQQNSIQDTVKTPPDKTGITTTNKELNKETENLEDWLDSVLD
ncbi:cell death regulator Aven-like [Pecten maximus]|uniref:cell death regulator Aven-like n=1 Tax=Pecten maximus TaxID=6579 RepID=UPI0014583E5B|nr:cell death regulator Aven-like [Pecten maximus]